MDIQMTQEEIVLWLAKNRLLRIATVDEHGQPHVVPVDYVILDGQLYIETLESLKKAKNLRRNQRLSVVIDGEEKGQYKGIHIIGRAEFITDKPLHARFREAWAHRCFGSADHPAFQWVISFPDPALIRIVQEKVVTWDYGKGFEVPST